MVHYHHYLLCNIRGCYVLSEAPFRFMDVRIFILDTELIQKVPNHCTLDRYTGHRQIGSGCFVLCATYVILLIQKYKPDLYMYNKCMWHIGSKTKALGSKLSPYSLDCHYHFLITLIRSRQTVCISEAVVLRWILPDYDECSSNPCLNGGVCNNLASRYKCNCPAGWEGGRCDRGRHAVEA